MRMFLLFCFFEGGPHLFTGRHLQLSCDIVRGFVHQKHHDSRQHAFLYVHMK